MSIQRVMTLTCAAGALMVCLNSSQARADSVGSETAAGSNNSSETLSYMGTSSNHKATGNGLNWNLSYGNYRIKSITPVTKRQIVDRTITYSGGLGWDQSSWELGSDLSYSRTAAEDLNSFGPDAYLGYTFGPKHDSASAPSLEIKGTYAGQRYTAYFHNRVAPLTITQSAGSLEAVLTPVNWGSISETYTAYSYNRDIKRISALLDSTRAIVIGLSHLSSTVFGFPSHMSEATLTLGPFSKWTFELDSSYMISAVNKSITHATRYQLSRDIGNWTLGGGVEHDSIPESGGQNLGLLNIYYNF